MQMEGLGVWTAYANHRVRVGEKVQLYVSPERICRMHDAQSQKDSPKPDMKHDMSQNASAKQREVIAVAR
ncbi:hypothetical protein D3C74_387100 [compost metagenome]